jgi:hypothetical protein
MKRLLIVGLIIISLLVAVVIISGCGNDSEQKEYSSPESYQESYQERVDSITKNALSEKEQNALSEEEQMKLETCHDNMRLTDAAIMQYSAYNNGNYPPSIDALVPTFLESAPTEPFGGTYSLVPYKDGSSIVQAYCSLGHTY